MTTKADKIRATAKKHPTWGCTRIGKHCDCADSYVRVVLRQRVNGISEADRRYRSKPDYRRMANSYVRTWYWRQKAKREASHA
jgi:hypothetical protein